MKETREEYELKIRKEYISKLSVIADKEYSVLEIEKILKDNNIGKGILQFSPTKPHTGQKIIDTLTYIDMRVADAIHKNLGLYENKEKCDNCGEYFDGEDMEVVKQEKEDILVCKKCRKKLDKQ